MRYLIIGGTSIIGRGLIDLLLSKEETQFIISTKRNEESFFLRDKLEWIDLDVRDVSEMNRIVKYANADVVFDFATQDSVSFSWEKPVETVDINIVGTINLLNAIRDLSPKSRLIIGGSGEEYGHLKYDELPADEMRKPMPNNIFGATKACQTMFASLYNKAFDLDIIVVRAFYETSIHQDERFAISSFCKQFAEIELGKKAPILTTGNINNIRDFTDADDLVRAFACVAEKGKKGEIYNAAGGRYTSLDDIIACLQELTGIEVEIKMDPRRIRPMDSPALVADIKKIERDCGWRPEISIQKTIEKMLNVWREEISNSEIN